MRSQRAEETIKDGGNEDCETDDKSPSAMERELESALSVAGKFDLGTTAAGRLWLRQVREDADLKRKYAVITGYRSQREFRASWLQGE